MTRRTLSALPVTRCLHHRCGRLTGSGAAGACRLHKRAVSDLYRNVRYCCRVCGFDGARFRSIVLESVERLYDPPHIEHQSRLLLISVLGFMVNMVMIPIHCVPANRSAGGHLLLSRIPCTSGPFGVFALTRWPHTELQSSLYACD